MPRPEFETAALFINCCITDRAALVGLNHLCNEVGLDTMTTAAVIAAAMDLDRRACWRARREPARSATRDAMARAIEEHRATASGLLGELLGDPTDEIAHEILGRLGDARDGRPAVVPDHGVRRPRLRRDRAQGVPGDAHLLRHLQPRPRRPHLRLDGPGRGGGPRQDAGEIAAAGRQRPVGQGAGRLARAVRLLPLSTPASETFLRPALRRHRQPLLGRRSRTTCGRRIVDLERLLNNIQGRTRAYDAYIPPKLHGADERGPMKGRRVDPELPRRDPRRVLPRAGLDRGRPGERRRAGEARADASLTGFPHRSAARTVTSPTPSSAARLKAADEGARQVCGRPRSKDDQRGLHRRRRAAKGAVASFTLRSRARPR